MVRVLKQHDFDLVGQSGSHQKWRNVSNGKQVIVAYHRGRTLPLGTMKSIIEGSCIARMPRKLANERFYQARINGGVYDDAHNNWSIAMSRLSSTACKARGAVQDLFIDSHQICQRASLLSDCH